jgi:hypothetical protein
LKRISQALSKELHFRDKILIFMTYFLIYPIHLFYKIFYVESWSIYISNSLVEITKGVYKELFPHSNKNFAADPFFLDEKVLYEFAKRPFVKGKIMDFDFSQNNSTKEFISEEFHLSFPTSFKMNGSQYILPEMSTQIYQVIYEKKTDPNKKLEKINTCLPALVDPVIFSHKGEDFLMGTEPGILQNNLLKIIKIKDFKIDEEIQIFMSDEDARNGSKVFNEDGRLFRYAQNNLLYYGHSLTLQEIKVGWPQITFENLETLYPPPLFHGIHTLDHNGSAYVYDLKRYNFSFFNPLFLLLKKF